MLDPVLFFRVHAAQATPPTPLRSVRIDRKPFHVTLVRNGHDHVFFYDQVLDVEVPDRANDLRAPVVAIRLGDRLELVLEDAHADVL